MVKFEHIIAGGVNLDKTLNRSLLARSDLNDKQSMQKMPPTSNNVRSRLPTARTEEQQPI